jgi:hypothetical protein
MYWLDMRSEGQTFFIAESCEDNTPGTMLKTISTDEGGKGTSCQYAHELEKGIIQQGNKIVAAIGSQYLLNRLRGEKTAHSTWTATV